MKTAKKSDKNYTISDLQNAYLCRLKSREKHHQKSKKNFGIIAIGNFDKNEKTQALHGCRKKMCRQLRKYTRKNLMDGVQNAPFNPRGAKKIGCCDCG